MSTTQSPYVTAGGRHYCTVCSVYIGTKVGAPRCLNHCQQVNCSWCRRPILGTPSDHLPPECGGHCRSAQRQYQELLIDQAALTKLKRDLESRLEALQQHRA